MKKWKIGSVTVSLWPFVFLAISVIALIGYDLWVS
jgi:hypothetical protein